MCFPSSRRWTLCITPKSLKGWLKTRIFTRAGNSHHRVSVCLCVRVCVCVCHTPVFINTAKRRITQTTPRDSPGNLVF